MKKGFVPSSIVHLLWNSNRTRSTLAYSSYYYDSVPQRVNVQVKRINFSHSLYYFYCYNHGLGSYLLPYSIFLSISFLTHPRHQHDALCSVFTTAEQRIFGITFQYTFFLWTQICVHINTYFNTWILINKLNKVEILVGLAGIHSP